MVENADGQRFLPGVRLFWMAPVFTSPIWMAPFSNGPVFNVVFTFSRTMQICLRNGRNRCHNCGSVISVDAESLRFVGHLAEFFLLPAAGSVASTGCEC